MKVVVRFKSGAQRRVQGWNSILQAHFCQSSFIDGSTGSWKKFLSRFKRSPANQDPNQKTTIFAPNEEGITVIDYKTETILVGWQRGYPGHLRPDWDDTDSSFTENMKKNRIQVVGSVSSRSPLLRKTIRDWNEFHDTKDFFSRNGIVACRFEVDLAPWKIETFEIFRTHRINDPDEENQKMRKRLMSLGFEFRERDIKVWDAWAKERIVT